ncbi:S41 family peptidase [Nitrospirillum pindoramense]|nr:S41 family peptidase [Nitrospirillum amazonense]
MMMSWDGNRLVGCQGPRWLKKQEAMLGRAGMLNKIWRGSRLLRVSVCLLLIGSTAAGAVFYLRHKPSRVFDAAWDVVNTHYYDRTFNGYDWVKVGQTFRAKLPWWDSRGFDTAEVINSMLRLLESSHLDYQTPAQAEFAIGSEPGADLIFPDSMEMAGLSVIGPRHMKAPIITQIETDSYLYKQGVRVGDHILIGIHKDENGEDVISYYVTKIDGRKFEVKVNKSQMARGDDAPYIENRRIVFGNFDAASFVKLNALRTDPANADLTVFYRPSGIITTLGGAATDEGLSVIDVQKDSVADREGIEIGSFLRGMTSLPRQDGEDGIALTIQLPNGEERKFEAKVPISYIEGWQPYHRSAEKVGATLVIRFDKFNDENVDWVGMQLKQQNSGAVIFDLRNNSGGTVKAMQRFLGYFLPAGTTIMEQRGATETEMIKVSDGNAALSGSLAVLVGPASASAAEVSAAALQAYGRATIVGRKTSGDVLMARAYRLPNGGLIQVPEAALRDPKGRDLEGSGLTPDITVWKTLATIREGRDLPLEAALAVVTGAQAPPVKVPPAEAPGAAAARP